MGPLSYPVPRIGRYGKGPMNSKDGPYFSTLVGPRTHCFQFVKISLQSPRTISVLKFICVQNTHLAVTRMYESNNRYKEKASFFNYTQKSNNVYKYVAGCQ